MTLANVTQTFDRWAVKVILALRWRANPEIIARRIRDFEATEDDSAWHLLMSSTRVADPRVRSQLFLQAMEETHHAEIFRDLYRREVGRPMIKLNVERKPLLKPGQEWKIFAYCAVGEVAAASRFQNIADRLEDGFFKSSLRKIIAEEEGHVELAGQLVQLTGRSDREVKNEMRKIRLGRAWEAWLRIGRHVSAMVSRLLLSATYYAIGWWLRPRARGQI